jgi:lysyl-tRNA synthetase class II
MTRRTALAAAALAIGLLATATPAMAQSDHHGTTVSVSAAPHGKQKGHVHKAKIKFTLAGRLVSVDTTANTLTFTVHGGKKALRNTQLTVAVTPDTKLKRNGKAAALSTLQAGDHVSIKGTHVDTTWTATKVSAEARHAKKAHADKA